MNMLWFLYGLSASSFLASLYYVLAVLEPEATQGYVQKIFFFHVPSAFVMYAFAVLGMLFAVLYLFSKKNLHDLLSKSALYIASLFGFLVIVSGPIWAKPIWGVYWTWDPRLTSTFILFTLLIAYCVTRILLEKQNPQRAAFIGAILAIFAVLDIPLVHLSARLLRGLHPSVLKEPGGLPESYRTGLELMIISFFIFSTLLFWILYQYMLVKSKIDEWKGMKNL